MKEKISKQFLIFLDYRLWFLPVLLATFLVVISSYHYLLFHILAEFFSIAVGLLMFVIAFITYKHSQNHFLMYLASGYLWVAVLDLVHTLVYKGMSAYPFNDPNLAPQFWIATRYFEALLLFSAPFFLNKKFNHKVLTAVFGLLFIVIYSLIMSGNFPDAYIAGKGLTPFKINSEYIINTVLFLALGHLYMKYDQIDENLFPFLFLSIIFTICAEFAFTFYIDLYGISNLIGHIFKLFSFWLLFYSIVRISLNEPYKILEKRVKERTNKLNKSNKSLNTAEKVAHLGSWDWDIINNKLYWTDEIYRIFGVKPQEFEATYDAFIGFVHPDDRDKIKQAVEDTVTQNIPLMTNDFP